MAGQKVHTVEDTTVPRLYSMTEGLDFALLKEGVVRICGSGVRLRDGSNQIFLRRPIFLFRSIFVGHYHNVGISIAP